jgi:tetratricopeptide (TPR) repeat protein
MVCWTLMLGGASPAARQNGPALDPDRLYANRARLGDAQQAADIWTSAVAANPKDYTAAWKAARARYWLGGHVAGDEEKVAELQRGMDAARKAIAAAPERPEGHFWLAATMGALAELKGMRAGLKYRGAIRDELQRVLQIDPAFQQGSADRALGRWYYKVPGLFGGSKKKSEEHLRKSLTYNPNSTVSRYFLAETLLDMNRKPEAIAELERVLAITPDPDWAPEDEDYKRKAQQLLEKLRK